MVPREGFEPSRQILSNGFSYYYSFHYHFCLQSGLYLHHFTDGNRQVSTPSLLNQTIIKDVCHSDANTFVNPLFSQFLRFRKSCKILFVQIFNIYLLNMVDFSQHTLYKKELGSVLPVSSGFTEFDSFSPRSFLPWDSFVFLV